MMSDPGVFDGVEGQMQACLEAAQLGNLLFVSEQAGVDTRLIRAAFRRGGLLAAYEALGYETARLQHEATRQELRAAEFES